MKHSSTKVALLSFAASVACAFAMPSMASAASWGVIGSAHTLDASSVAFDIPAAGGGWTCTNTSSSVDVRSASILTFTTFDQPVCIGRGPSSGCTITRNLTKDLEVTAATSTNVVVSGVHIDYYLETPVGGGTCHLHNRSVTIGGQFTGGVWDAAAHQITFTSAPGLTATFDTGQKFPVTVTATFRDTQQTLTLL